MKTFFYLSIITFLSILAISNAQENRPFSHCYQEKFEDCSNCSDSVVLSKSISYMNCDVIVVYKKMHCECPEPITFIDIEFLYVDLTSCPALLCWLHPGPTPCINNPLDVSRYHIFETDMYELLASRLFIEDSSLYHCNTVNKYRYYYPGQCVRTCYYQILGTNGGGMIYMEEACEGIIGCCGKEFVKCVNTDGTINSYSNLISDPYICFGGYPPPCYYNENDPIWIGNQLMYVQSVSVTNCFSVCEE